MSERSRAMHERRKDVFIGSLPGIIRFSSKSSKRDRAEKCSGMRYPGRCGMAFRTIASTSVQIPERMVASLWQSAKVSPAVAYFHAATAFRSRGWLCLFSL
ncbi:MAG: hypothetical protein ACYCRE_06275 [Acidobacteriaceae bacterium]